MTSLVMSQTTAHVIAWVIVCFLLLMLAWFVVKSLARILVIVLAVINNAPERKPRR